MNSDEVPHAVPLTEEEQWDLQMKRLEEIDRLTTEAEQNIPLELRSTLLVLIKKFPGLQRLPAFQLMGSYDWNLDRLTALSDVLHRIPNSKILATVDFLLSLIKIEDNQWKLHYLGLHIFSQLKAQYIVEWSTEVSENNRIFLMQIARHLSPTDLELMIYNIHELSVQEMIDMIQSIQQNPERKQCELCRQKRLFSLEYRMRTDTMPKQHLPTPGIIPYLDRNVEYWGADDEKLFSFDLENGQIFWSQSYPVNLIDICEKCLLDSHQAITNQGRNDAIYHLPPDQRKDAYAYQRLVEQGLATMVSKVAKERAYRRLREFAIQAINSQKSGIKVEDDEKEAILIKMKQEEELLQKKKERELLNEQALAVDEKWFDNDEMTTRKDLDKRRAYTLLKFHLGYDGEKTLAPTARKRRTWRLQDFDSAGLPLNASAANRMFGISHEIDVDDGPRIDYWKIISEERMANLKEKERIKKQLQREKELEEIQQLKNYVNDRMITLNKYGLQQQRLTEENERRRQLERLEAKERRRKEKYEKYLQYEKNCLEYEDYRSYQLREYSYELERELMERENMFNEELEQTEMDRFWGFDVYYQRMKVEENRLHDFYIQQIQEKNHQLSIMRCTKKIPKKYFTSYLPSIAKAATVMKTDFTIPPPSPEQIIMRNSSKIPTLPAIVSPKENLSSKPSYTLQSPTTSILKSGGVLSSSIDSLTPSKQSVNFASNSKETDTMNSYDERDQKEEAAKVTLKVDLSQLQSLSRPMSKQEMYEYQYEVNEYEKQKHLQYIKQLKAEEIRVKTRAKLRTPVYSR